MRNFSRRLILAVVTALALVCCFALAACGGGDNGTKYKVQLDLDGGQLSTTTIELESGANVYDAVKNLEPKKDDCFFDGWYEGETKLSETRTMPAEDITLKAHYIQGIPVEYRANVPASAPVGTSARGTTPRQLLHPGESTKIAENGFSIEGYRFMGWTKSAGGILPDDVNCAVGTEITPDAAVTYYATWTKALTDRFGGQDYIFCPENEMDKVYLSRGGIELEGTLSGSDFSVTLPNGTVLKGRQFNGETYAYEKPEIAGDYKRYDCYIYPAGAASLIESDTLTITAYGDATRVYRDEVTNATVTDTGYITRFSGDEYMFNCESGEHTGEVVVFRLDTYDPDGTGSRPAVDVYKATQGEAGDYGEFLTPDGSVGGLGYGSVILDGYGSITFWEVFEGNYEVLDSYGNGTQYVLYKIRAYLHDVNNQLAALQGMGYSYELNEDGVFVVNFYTIPLMDSYGYVEPHVEVGTYEGTGSMEGDTLVLDGYGNLPDSAIYTHGGDDAIYGNYLTTASAVDGTVLITMTEVDEYGIPTDRTRSFRLLAGEGLFELVGTFSGANEGIEYPFTDYLPLTSSGMSLTEVLRVYDRDYTAEGVTDAVYADLIFGTAVKDENGITTKYDYKTVANGYVTYEILEGGNATVYTFHLIGKAQGVTQKIAESFEFMTSTAYDAINLLSLPVFYTYEATYRNDDGTTYTDKFYTEIKEDGGEGSIRWMNLGSSLAYGSLYYTGDGSVYSGSFRFSESGYVFGPFGIFEYTDYELFQTVTYFFDIQMASGQPALYTVVPEIEQPVFRFNSTGELDTQNVYFAIRGDEALYSPSGSLGMTGTVEQPLRGVIEEVGQTPFGETICSFMVNDVERFRFIYTSYDYYEMGFGTQQILVYYVYNTSLASKVPNLTLTGENGTLLLDGYHLASLTDANGVVHEGSYYTNVETTDHPETVIFFRGGNGTDAYLVSGSSYTVLDSAYGSRPFYYRGESYSIRFDGLGNFTAHLGNREVGSGRYNILEGDPVQYELIGQVNKTSWDLTVTSTIDGLTVRNEDTSGVYISDDFAILRLDGYGSGTYFPADGSGGRTIYFDIASSEDGYLAARSEYFEYFNFVLDNENMKFRTPTYLAESVTYYATDFNTLVLDREGSAWLNGSDGYYQIVDNTLKLYLRDPNTYEFGTTTVSSLPTGETYVVNGKTFYRWENEDGPVTFNGTLEVKDGQGQTTDTYTATLTFRANGDTMFYASATFTYTISGRSESVTMQVVNRYYDYVNGVYRGLALYDPVTYEYSPFDTYTYNPTGESTFHTVIKEQVMRMYDGFEEVPEGAEAQNYLEETHIGFGPINITDIKLSGRLLLGNGKVLEFKNAPVVTIEHNSTTMGPMYMSVFTVGGETYAVDYNKFDGDYWLYMIATYSELEAEENGTQYTVGLQKFLHSTGGYEFDASLKVGDLHKVVLYSGRGDSKVAIETFNGKVNADNSAWLLALGNYDVNASNPKDEDLGKVYLFDFAEGLTSVTIHSYEFVQAPLANVTLACYVNFAVKDDDKIEKPIAMLIWNTDSYDLLLFRSMEKTGDNTWTFHGVNGYAYTIRVETKPDGSYQTTTDGNWVVNLVSQTDESAAATQPNA